MFPLANITVLDVTTSDHLPLSLKLNRKMNVPKLHRFLFENMWLRETECAHIIQKCWQELTNHTITEKIQYCGVKLEE